MKKKGQIALLIVIGLVVLFAFGFLIYAKNIGTRGTPATITQGLGLSSQKMSLESKVNYCIEQKTKEAIDLFGLKQTSEKLIRDYVEANLIECIEFELFENQGITILRQNGFARIDITERAVIVNVYYPVTLVKSGLEEDMSRYNFHLSRTEKERLALDSDNALERAVTIVTEDGDAELVIRPGTIVTKDGQPFDDIELKVVDKNFDGLSNKVVIGSVVYQGTDGVYFDPAAVLKIHYEEADLPSGTAENDLVIMWYDQEKDLWKSLPTTVDTINNEAIALISHFTYVGIGGDVCKLAGINKQLIVSGIIFKEECRECTSSTDGSIYFTEPGVVPLPDSEGEHFGQGCDGPKDWDNDDAGDDCGCPDRLIKDITLPPGYTGGDGIKKGSCVYTPAEPDDPLTPDINERETESCEYEPATPPTYGYNSLQDVGGWGDFKFAVFPKGDGCVALDDEDSVSVDVDVISPSGDATFWKLNDVSEDSAEIQGGTNTLHAEVYNSDDKACAEVIAVITFNGFGALPECQAGEWVTQDSANCHCGKTNIDTANLGQDMFCCNLEPYAGILVDGPSECGLMENQCLQTGQTETILTADITGCFCNEQQYEGTGDYHYCCDYGLSAEPCKELCAFDFPDNILDELNIPIIGQAITDITGAGTTNTRLYEGSCQGIDILEIWQTARDILAGDLCSQDVEAAGFSEICELITSEGIINAVVSQTSFARWCQRPENIQTCARLSGAVITFNLNRPTTIAYDCESMGYNCCKVVGDPCRENCICADGDAYMSDLYTCPAGRFCCAGGCARPPPGTCSDNGGECCDTAHGYICELGHNMGAFEESCGGMDCCEKGFCRRSEQQPVGLEKCENGLVCCENGCSGDVSFGFDCGASNKVCCDSCKPAESRNPIIDFICGIFGFLPFC